MKITVRKALLATFRRKARKAFAREEFAILLGTATDGQIDITDLYFPKERIAASTDDQVNISAEWYFDAERRGRELGLVVVGDIHSHCYDYRPDLELPDRGPSEQDWNSIELLRRVFPSFLVMGICRVVESKKHRLSTSLKLWSAPPSFELSVVD